MSVTQLAPPRQAWSAQSMVGSLVASRRWVLPVIFALWALIPEVRRLVDWRVGFSFLPIIAIVPIVALVPLIVFLRKQKGPALPKPLGVLVTAWTVGFGFATLVGIFSNGPLSALYTAAEFFLPMLIAVFIARSLDPREAFYDVAKAMLVVGVIISVYGIYQYVAPPPWDVYWVDNADIASIGSPVPFGLRIFSTLNSPGALGDFLALVILLQLPGIERPGGRIWRLGGVVLLVAALALTYDRSAWVACAVGVVTFLVCSPGRMRSFLALGGLAAAVTAIVVLGPALFPNTPAFTDLSTRLSTFTDLQSDDSYLDRQGETSQATEEALSDPIGLGLGALGTSTKLGKSAAVTVLDNGVLSRFLEMGYIGFGAYLVTLIAGLWYALSARSKSRFLDPQAIAIAAVCVAVEVALLGLDFSSDHHSGLSGIFFWLVVGVSCLLLPQADEARIRAIMRTSH